MEAATWQDLKKGSSTDFSPTKQKSSQGWTVFMPDQPVHVQASKYTEIHSSLEPDVPLSYNPVISKKTIFCFYSAYSNLLSYIASLSGGAITACD